MRAGGVFLLVVLLAVGCGDAESEPAPEPAQRESAPSVVGPSAERLAFIEAADRICEPGNLRLEQLGKATAQTIPQAVEIVRETTPELEALEPPPELVIEWRQFLSALEDQNRYGEQLVAALEAGETGDSLVRQLQEAGERKSEVAGEIGFAECGTG